MLFWPTYFCASVPYTRIHVCVHTLCIYNSALPAAEEHDKGNLKMSGELNLHHYAWGLIILSTRNKIVNVRKSKCQSERIIDERDKSDMLFLYADN